MRKRGDSSPSRRNGSFRFLFFFLCFLCLTTTSSFVSGAIRDKDEPCADEEKSLEKCSEELLDPDDPDENRPDLDEFCADEINALDQCFVDNDITGGLRKCRYLVSFWNTCRLTFNLVLTCRNCAYTSFEETCDEFAENWCERHNCCTPCQHILPDYLKCLEKNEVCQEDEYLSCEDEIRLDFWGKFFIGVAGAVCCGCIVYGLVLYSRKQKENHTMMEKDGMLKNEIAEAQDVGNEKLAEVEATKLKQEQPVSDDGQNAGHDRSDPVVET